MGYELVISEKPKQAMRIAYALSDKKPIVKRSGGANYFELERNGKKLVVASAVGHIFGLKEVKQNHWSYPVFNVEWRPVFEVEPKAWFAKRYYELLKQLAAKASDFTLSCDYDIEGELIGYNVLRFICGTEKAGRMKFSTLTKGELVEAYEHKAPEINLPQAKAGEARHYLDWYYGINVSRALTGALKSSGVFKVLSSGRVQGPALKIVVDREREIQAFKPQPFWRLLYTGKLSGANLVFHHAKDRFWDEKEALAVFQKCMGKDGKVDAYAAEEVLHYPPIPFDLTSLQVEAYRYLGMSPQESLERAQELYLSGLISYPRTSSQKLPYTLGFRRIIEGLSKLPGMESHCSVLLKKEKLIPRQGKQEDPAHPAIYPTGTLPKTLSKRLAPLYDLIVRRFLALFGEPAKRLKVRINIKVEGEEFLVEGISTLEPGWYGIYKPYLKVEEQPLPKVRRGEPVEYMNLEKQEDSTKPPKRFNQASLVKELSKRNLGTKATRATIVETLFKRGYVKGKEITPTSLGINVVEILEKRVPEIIDEELTRSFEEDMEKIREGKLSEEQVLAKARELLTKVLHDFKRREMGIGEELKQAKLKADKDASLGVCPVCKEGKLMIKTSKQRKRFLACDRYPECRTTFSVPQQGKLYKTEKPCQKCGFPLIRIYVAGRKRAVTQCINPACPTAQSKNADKPCPQCGQGKLVVRNSSYGRFLACDRFPQCKYTERM